MSDYLTKRNKKKTPTHKRQIYTNERRASSGFYVCMLVSLSDPFEVDDYEAVVVDLRITVGVEIKKSIWVGQV